MRAWLKRLLERKPTWPDVERRRPPSPWKGVGDFYLAQYTDRLEKIAAALSSIERRVRVRFNTEKKCAELYAPRGEILADINVHGECCTATTMLIRPYVPLGVAYGLFEKFVPLRIKFETA